MVRPFVHRNKPQAYNYTAGENLALVRTVDLRRNNENALGWSTNKKLDGFFTAAACVTDGTAFVRLSVVNKHG